LYCTVAEMKDEVSELKTLVDAGKITEATVTSWITKGDTIINSYCASRYIVPFTTVPPLIKTLSEELATFFFFRDQDRAEEMRVNIWARVRELLEKIRDGEQRLIDADGNAVVMDTSQADRPWSDRLNVDPIFNMKDATEQSITPSDYD